MKIGILRESKTPVDNRVALTPLQIKSLINQYPHTSFKVQSSNIRSYTDDEYIKEGIEVCDDISDCELFLGIKEAEKSTLLPNKHYIFFGHIAKKQEYNIPLFKKLLELKNTFTDYEYIVDDNNSRLVAFGWYAGIVGVYYTLMGWGLKTKRYTLPKPNNHTTIDDLIENLSKIEITGLKIVLTGRGRVSQGAQYFLQKIGAVELSPKNYLKASDVKGIVYCVLGIDELVASESGDKVVNRLDFINHPENYHQIFSPYTKETDILITCHFWSNNQPVYLNEEEYLLPGFRIKMIGDITCDIKGSIKSTVRSSTHDKPFFDYNPVTRKEEDAFSNDRNISVMAVDTCPNALPRITSNYFGELLINNVLNDLLEKDKNSNKILDRATIIKDGKLTEYFNYLEDYISTF